MIQWVYSSRFRRVEFALVVLTTAAYGASISLTAARLEMLYDSAVRWAAAFIVVQTAVQVLLILGLIVSKQARTRLESSRRSRMRAIEDLLVQPDADREVRHAAARWPVEFVSVAELALQSLTGSARARVEGWLKASAAYRRLLEDSGASDPGRVIRALSVLGRLKDEEARQVVRANLDHPTAAVRRAARKAAIIGGAEELRARVLKDLILLAPWERIILFGLFPWDGSLIRYLEESLVCDESPRILVALEFLLTRQRVFVSTVPARLASSANLEIRIRFFRALPFLRLDQTVEAVLELGLHDPDWRARAAAAKACGSLRASHFAGRLLEMCRVFEDSAEAGHAARALSALGSEGWERLQEAAAGGGEVSHRIAAEVLERRMVGRESVR